MDELTNLETINKLKEIGRKKGFSNAQVNSTTFTATLFLIADYCNGGGEVFESLKNDCTNAIREAVNAANKLRHLGGLVATAKMNYESELKDLLSVVERLRSLLNDILTPNSEMLRDRIKVAKYYRENIEINSCYDNTAYINRLGAILSNTNEDKPEKQKAAKAEKGDYSYRTITEALNGIAESIKHALETLSEREKWEV